MKSDTPVETLAAALYSAALIDLDPTEHEEIEFRRTPGVKGTQRIHTGRMAKVRPRHDQCSVFAMFEQTWGSTALGFGGIGGQAITSAYTVIVEGPMGDVCVYFAGRLAYHIRRPNNAFWEDAASRQMHAVAGAVTRYARKDDLASPA